MNHCQEDDYETNEKTACICTGICDDHHDLSAISGICSNPKTRLNAKTMTLQVGQKKTLKVKNAGKKAKLKYPAIRNPLQPFPKGSSKGSKSRKCCRYL